MQRKKALAVVLVAAMSGTLLVGCTSGNVTTGTSTAPATGRLVGTWVAEHSDHTISVLEFRADGTATYSYGDTRGTVEVWNHATYQADEDSLTYLITYDCDDPTEKATYAYTLVNDQVTFRLTSGDDKCTERKDAFAFTAFTRETGASPVSSSSQQWASLIATEGAAIRRSHEALEALDEAIYGGNAGQGRAFETEINAAASNVGRTAEDLNDALVTGIRTLGQPPVEVSALVDSMLIATEEAVDAAFDTNEYVMAATLAFNLSAQARHYESWGPPRNSFAH